MKRREFVNLLINEMNKNEKIFLLTGDLGFGLFDDIRKDFPNRFINVGSCEQLMIGLAVGLSYEGWIPLCYSITPFLLYRPFEFIRNYLNHELANVKLVGGGRDKDYKNLGFSHWAEDDVKIMSSLENIEIYKPETMSAEIFNEFIYNNKPSYINLIR
jgi:transketolase